MSWIDDLEKEIPELRKTSEQAAAAGELSSKITNDALRELEKIADVAAQKIEFDAIPNPTVRYTRLALIGLGLGDYIDILLATDFNHVDPVISRLVKDHQIASVIPAERERKLIMEASLGKRDFGMNDHLNIRVASPSHHQITRTGFFGRSISYFEPNKNGTLLLVEEIAKSCGFLSPDKSIVEIWKDREKLLTVPHPTKALNFLAKPNNPTTPKDPLDWATQVVIRRRPLPPVTS